MLIKSLFTIILNCCCLLNLLVSAESYENVQNADISKAPTSGLLVQSVNDNSQAIRIDLRAGDIITQIDDISLQLTWVLNNARNGETQLLHWWSKDDQRFKSAQIEPGLIGIHTLTHVDYLSYYKQHASELYQPIVDKLTAYHNDFDHFKANPLSAVYTGNDPLNLAFVDLIQIIRDHPMQWPRDHIISLLTHIEQGTISAQLTEWTGDLIAMEAFLVNERDIFRRSRQVWPSLQRRSVSSRYDRREYLPFVNQFTDLTTSSVIDVTDYAIAIDRGQLFDNIFSKHAAQYNLPHGTYNNMTYALPPLAGAHTAYYTTFFCRLVESEGEKTQWASQIWLRMGKTIGRTADLSIYGTDPGSQSEATFSDFKLDISGTSRFDTLPVATLEGWNHIELWETVSHVVGYINGFRAFVVTKQESDLVAPFQYRLHIQSSNFMIKDFHIHQVTNSTH